MSYGLFFCNHLLILSGPVGVAIPIKAIEEEFKFDVPISSIDPRNDRSWQPLAEQYNVSNINPLPPIEMEMLVSHQSPYLGEKKDFPRWEFFNFQVPEGYVIKNARYVLQYSPYTDVRHLLDIYLDDKPAETSQSAGGVLEGNFL